MFKMEKNGYFRGNIHFFPFLAFPGYPFFPFFFHFFFGWEKISIFPTYGHCAPQISFFCDFRPPCPPPHITFSCFLSLVFQRIEFPNKHFQEHYSDLLCFAWLVFPKCLVTSIANVFHERKYSNGPYVAIVKYIPYKFLTNEEICSFISSVPGWATATKKLRNIKKQRLK